MSRKIDISTVFHRENSSRDGTPMAETVFRRMCTFGKVGPYTYVSLSAVGLRPTYCCGSDASFSGTFLRSRFGPTVTARMQPAACF